MDWSWRVCNRTVVQGFGRNLAELFFVFFFFFRDSNFESTGEFSLKRCFSRNNSSL